MDLDSLAPFAVLEIEPASRDSQPIASPETCGFGSGREKRELERKRKRVAGDQDALVLTPVSGPQHRTAAVSAVHARGLMAVMHVHVCATCHVTGGGRAAHACLCTHCAELTALQSATASPAQAPAGWAGSLAPRSRARTSRFSSPRAPRRRALLLFLITIFMPDLSFTLSFMHRPAFLARHPAHNK